MLLLASYRPGLSQQSNVAAREAGWPSAQQQKKSSVIVEKSQTRYWNTISLLPQPASILVKGVKDLALHTSSELGSSDTDSFPEGS